MTPLALDCDAMAKALGARHVEPIHPVQSLWGGYGAIMRVRVDGGGARTVIVKQIEPPQVERGSLSHRRKLRSYVIEARFYQDWSGTLEPDRCRVPRRLGSLGEPGRGCLLLEDLDAAGYTQRRGAVEPCLRWLAAFHAAFLGRAPEGLWTTGTYWHLETRPDELAAIRDGVLRRAAGAIDEALRGARFQTLVHGDAKLANFCFHPDGRVAAVDFQYVGGGCGMKDVAYLLSCLGERELEHRGEDLLELYFSELRGHLAGSDVDTSALEFEWRALYPWAWADFMRFLAGWSPGSYEHERYGQRQLRAVLATL